MKRAITIFSASTSLLALVLATTGCDTDAFCFGCEDNSSTSSGAMGGNGGMGGQGGEGGIIIVGSGGAAGMGGSCAADTMTDPLNCGKCGNVCSLPNAFPTCEGGFCLVDTCAAGFIDLNNQVTDGCEYKCTVSNNGDEICDTLDNDCNGQVDELTDLQTDPINCGACNAVCTYANASGACNQGVCALDQCFVGYYDVNQDPNDGCEYACTVTNGGVEVCDYADNDCDQAIDEGFDVQSDNNNCGTCGNDCTSLYPNTIPTCTTGVCALGACLPNYYNLDGIDANGCEYNCTPTGAEACNGKDDDCNGSIDDGMLPSIGDACGMSDIGECLLGALACQAGTLVCVGEIGPDVELCDTLDNDCTGAADEGCPIVKATDTRLDVGANSGVGQATSTQLSVASLGDTTLATYLDRRTGDADIRANISTDGGKTWQASDVQVAGSSLVQVEPWAFLSPTRAYVALAQFPSAAHRDVYIASATAPYTSYTVPTRVDKDATSADAFLIRGVVAKPGASDTLVIVWQSLSGTGGNVTTDIYLQRSTNNGSTWLASDLRVNTIPGKAEQPAIATDGNGKVFLTWRDARNGKSEVFADVYDTTTGTLSGNIAISGGNPSEQLTIAADPSGPNVYIAWTDLRAAKKVIRMNRSTTNGATFQNDGTIINTDSTFADASSPTIAANAGRVALAWEDTRSGVADIRINVSTNAGSTFHPTSARADLGTLAGTSASTKPRITLGAGPLILVTWEDTRNGQRDIYANHSNDNGQTFQPLDLRIDTGSPAAPSPPGSADSRNPFITTNNSATRGIITWIDNRTNTGTNGANADIYTNYFE